MERRILYLRVILMSKQVLNVEENLNHIQNSNGKLYFLCLMVGLITGIIVSFYRYALHIFNVLRETFVSPNTLTNYPFLIKLWIGFLVIGFFIDFLYRKYPRTSGSGIPQVKGIILGTVHYKHWFAQLVAKFVGGLFGIGAGLSLGREGPSVQLGSYVASGIAKGFRCNRVDENYLITSGASAGLAGAFGAPLAGVMFSLEELHKFLTAKLIICIFVASIASDFIGRRFFGIDTAFSMLVSYPRDINPYLQFALYILFGILIAFFGKLFTTTLVKTQNIFQGIRISRWMKVVFVMSTSFLLCLVLPEVTGGGHELVESLPQLQQGILFLFFVFLIKLLFTSLSYATGFAGGIFLPMLVLGAILGKIFALLLLHFFPFDPNIIVHFMVLGMVGYFVSVVRAPITGAVLILEMTGSFDHLLALVTVSVVAFYVTALLKLAPVYDILYERMPKDDFEETHEVESMGKTLIVVPVAAESYLDGKKISEVEWGEEVLVVALRRNETEKIPKGDSIMRSGDNIVLLLPESIVAEVKETILQKGIE
ncbi:Chloride transporter, ClC family [Fusobacterium necrophorum subsp. funduliforme]